MERGQVVVSGEFHRTLHQCRCPRHLMPRPGQEAAPGGGGEGYADLKLRVILPARLFIGMGPVEIEDIFALTMPLGIKPGDGDQLSTLTGEERPGRPTAPPPDGAAAFERRQKAMGGEGIDGASALRRLGAGAGIPIRSRDLGKAGLNGKVDPLCHRRVRRGTSQSCAATRRGQEGLRAG